MEREKLVALVRAVQRGKESAAGDLYDAFYDDIYYYILKTVDNDPELAADLTQDTFMEILETIGKLQEPAAFVTWSKQIAYHKCTAYFRKRREILLDEQEDGYSVFDTVEEERAEFIPDEALDQEDFKQTIHAMINALPNEQRSALLLRYFNEISVKEIAQIQGVTEGTVKSRLNYARKAIQQAVESYEKKNNVRLHCAGVLPMLLWFFRAYRRASGMAITSGTAGAVYAAAGAGSVASASGAAAASATAVKAGAAAGAKAAGKVAATKIIAAVAAASVTVAGVAAVVTNVLNKPKAEKWSGYVEEVQVFYNWIEMEEGGRPEETVIPVEDGRMYFELELLEAEEYAYNGNLTVTWEDGEVYHTKCRLTDFLEGDSELYYDIYIDPLYLRAGPGEASFADFLSYVGFTYDPDTDTASIELIAHESRIYGELTRETPEETILLSQPIRELPMSEAVPQEGRLLTYTKRIDGTYGWVDDAEMEAIQRHYADPPEQGNPYRGYQTIVYLQKPGSKEVTAHMSMTLRSQDPITHAVIESEVDGMPVTRIRYFLGRDMETVELPDTLVIIEDVAFANAELLKKIEIPESVRHIGAGAFENCTSLEKIKLHEGVQIIGEEAFAKCPVLRTIELPEGVKTVGSLLFYQCTALEEVTLPSTLVEVEDYLFYECPSLETLEVAPGNPVYHSSGNCIIETESKTLYAGCKTSQIPSDGSVTAIGRYAFAGNTDVTEITIPEGVTEIGYCAFVKCGNLAEITLPASIKTIDDQAFKFCDSLTDIYYAGTMAEFGKIQGIRWDGSYHDFNLTVHCSDGDLTTG